jgi:uncharacterized protein YlxW (UPF0749 family)
MTNKSVALALLVLVAGGAFSATSQETPQSPLETSFDVVLAQATVTGQANADTLEAELPQHIERVRSEQESQRQANRLSILQRRLGRAQQRGDTKLVT